MPQSRTAGKEESCSQIDPCRSRRDSCSARGESSAEAEKSSPFRREAVLCKAEELGPKSKASSTATGSDTIPHTVL